MKRLFRSFTALLALISSLTLLLSVLTAYVNPSKMWVLAFLGFAFPVLWFFNLAIGVLFAIKRRWAALWPLLAVAFTWAHMVNTIQLTGKDVPGQTQGQEHLKVMSFNVRMFDCYNWTKQKDVQGQIFDLIKKENPDVLCLQEFYTTSGTGYYSEQKILSRLNQYPYRHIEYRSGKKGKRNFGLATFSKYPIKNKESLKFEHTSNFSIQTDIKAHNKTVRIFNNHLESIRFTSQHLNFLDSLNHKNEKERREGIRVIADKMKTAFGHRASQAERIGRHIANSPFPAIVCGDFNDTPVSYVYRKMRGELKDAFVASGSGIGGTYNGKLPSLRIDFIFHDEQFSSYGFKKLDVNLSDHFPILTTVNLSGETVK